MGDDTADAEALRRRLYRPGASDADVASYRGAVQVREPEPGPEPAGAAHDAAPARRSRRRVGIVLVGGLLLVALLGAVLVLQHAAPSATPTRPPVVAAAPRDPGDALVVLPTVEDRGVEAGATGAAQRLAAGRYRYTVATGDTVIGVASRFGLCRGEVTAALPIGLRPPGMRPGRVLVLRRDRDAIRRSASGTC